MLQCIPKKNQSLFLIVAALIAAAPGIVIGQGQMAMVPINPKPGTYLQVASNSTGQMTTASGTMQANPVQVQGAWQPIPGYTTTASGATGNGFYQQPIQYGAYNPAVTAGYRVAQVPQQGYPQAAPPVYVPQSYVAPGAQAYPGYPPAQYGINCNQTLWTAQVNWLYMTRAKSKSFPLVTDAGGATLVNADQFDFGWETGFDVGLSRRYGPTMNFELRYFQIDGWSSTLDSTFVGSDRLMTSPPTPFVLAGTSNYVYESLLRSFEANFVNRISSTSQGRLAIGFRWLTVRENLSQTFAFGLPSDSVLNTSTKNNLYGLQLATDGTLYNSGYFALNAWVKGGIYANVGSQNTTLTPPGTFSEIDRTTASFIGETGIVADYQLLPNVSLIGGYQLLFVSGVALAADQLPNMSSVGTGLVPAVLDQSDVFYHGVLVGIDIHW